MMDDCAFPTTFNLSAYIKKEIGMQSKELSR